MLVSGMTISRKTYFEKFSEGLKDLEVLDNSTKEAFVVAWKSLGDNSNASENAEENNEPSEYIHLREAKIYDPSGEKSLSPKGGFLWRGKLSSVDAFTLGTLSSRWWVDLIDTLIKSK